MATEKQLTAFQISLFCGTNTESTAEHTYSDTADGWEDYQIIKMPGFAGPQTIRLERLWNIIFTQQPACTEMEVFGPETIVKYSGTQKLKERFTIVAQLQYQ